MRKIFILLAVIVMASILSTVTADTRLDNLKSKFSSLFQTSGTAPPTELLDDLCKFDGYSFKSLTDKPHKGYNVKEPDHYTYTLTFCDKAQEANCAAVQGSICEYDNTQGDIFVASLGSFTDTEKPPVYSYIDETDKSLGVELRFANGGKCYTSGGFIDREVTVRMTCGSLENEFILSQDVPCHYTIDFPNRAVCSGGAGGSSGLSGGAIFLITVLCVFVIYIIAGCAICITKYGKPFGLQACPHREFWFGLPGLFVAGIKYTIGKIRGCCGSKTITTSSGEYEAA